MTRARTVGEKRRQKRRQPSAPPPLLDRQPAHIPTLETMAHGEYEQAQIEKNGAKVSINRANSPLRLYERAGTITPAQREAGELFEALHRLVWGGGRADILAQVIRGLTHETDLQVDRIIRAKRMLREVEARVSKAAYNRLWNCCIDQLHIGRNLAANRENYDNLRAGLDACVDVFGIPADAS